MVIAWIALFVVISVSTRVSQVRAALADREWLWVRDKFVSSERIAFEVPSAAIPPLSAVSRLHVPRREPIRCSTGGKQLC